MTTVSKPHVDKVIQEIRTLRTRLASEIVSPKKEERDLNKSLQRKLRDSHLELQHQVEENEAEKRRKDRIEKGYEEIAADLRVLVESKEEELNSIRDVLLKNRESQVRSFSKLFFLFLGPIRG
jgi:hypothetical protein